MQAAFTGKDTVIFALGLEYAASCRYDDGWWYWEPDFVTANFAGRFYRVRFCAGVGVCGFPVRDGVGMYLYCFWTRRHLDGGMAISVLPV